MTPPSVRVNIYVKANDTSLIDCVSKIFIIGGLCLGINRLPLFTKVNAVLMIFSLIISFVYMCYFLFIFYNIILKITICTYSIQWIFIIIFNLASIKRLQCFYNELNEFDTEVGCRPKIGKGSIRNLIVTVVMILYIVGLFGLSKIMKSLLGIYLSMIVFPLCNILEVHYYGHLLSLLIPRLRLINYYMELSLSKRKISNASNIEEFGYLKVDSNKSLCEMEKVMNLYHNMLKAFNYLVEAVKWQLLVSLVAAFIVILIGAYNISLLVLKDIVPVYDITSFMLFIIGLILPWFSPCIFGDQVHYEVVRLRELLASRIHENQMDRSCRVMARALLAWTEKKDLSFRLLRMLDIDISLPFKFVGLLITYVIILLQFQKIIDL